MKEFGTKLDAVQYVERPGAYALSFNNKGEMALIKTSKGYFLPGGGVNKDEDLEEALAREVYEETGFLISEAVLVGQSAQYVFAKEEGVYFKKMGFFYKCLLGEKSTLPLDSDHKLIFKNRKFAIENLSQEFQVYAVQEFVVDKE